MSIGTADDVIKGKPDILLVNAFGFWQGEEIGNATHTYFDDLMQAYTHIQSVAGSTTSIELWNGETGWPSDGMYHCV
jgi:glucan 1,3-beta-glucosidase